VLEPGAAACFTLFSAPEDPVKTILDNSFAAGLITNGDKTLW